MATLGSKWMFDSVSNTYKCRCPAQTCGNSGGGIGGYLSYYCVDWYDIYGVLYNACYDDCNSLHAATGAGVIEESSYGECHSIAEGDPTLCCTSYRIARYAFYVPGQPGGIYEDSWEPVYTCAMICGGIC
jgi:hypothetical protein